MPGRCLSVCAFVCHVRIDITAGMRHTKRHSKHAQTQHDVLMNTIIVCKLERVRLCVVHALLL